MWWSERESGRKFDAEQGDCLSGEVKQSDSLLKRMLRRNRCVVERIPPRCTGVQVDFHSNGWIFEFKHGELLVVQSL